MGLQVRNRMLEVCRHGQRSVAIARPTASQSQAVAKGPAQELHKFPSFEKDLKREKGPTAKNNEGNHGLGADLATGCY